MQGAQRRCPCRWSGFAGLACALFIGCLPLTDFLERLELRSQDVRFEWRGPRQTHSRIVIAAITEETLQAWQEPIIFWGGHYGNLIEQSRTQGAEWIGLDAIQQKDVDAEYAPQQLPTQRLAQALLNANGHVVLSNLRSTIGESVNPASRLTMLDETAVNIGFVDFPAQVEDTVRTYALFVKDQEGLVPSFAALLAAHVRGEAPENTQALSSLAGVPVTNSNVTTFWINYTGHSFPTISAERLAAGHLNDDERQKIHGAIVLIGATHRLSNDKHRIPGRGYVSGVEVQAQALATLLDGLALHRGTREQEALFTLALALLMAILITRLTFGKGLLLIGGAGVIWIVVALDAFKAFNCLLPLIGPLLGLALPWLVFHSVRSLEEGVLRLQIEAVFGRNVSAEIRDYLLSDPAHRNLGGEERESTILFMDIRGFTTYAEERKPSEVMQELNALFKEIVPAIDRHRGLLYKFTGDGLLAVFGVPFPLENDHAQAAVAAAVEIVQAVRRVNEERTRKNLLTWQIGCGLHSGMVLYGNMGIAERSEFTVTGDTVNLASRLEELNKEMDSEILISQATYDHLTDRSSVDGQQEYPIRGRSGPVSIYRVRVMGK